MVEGDRTVEVLLGTRLGAVTFVEDYVQLQFGGVILSAYTLPEVEATGRRWTSRDAGWRDELCAWIGISVRAASVSDQDLALIFEDSSAIRVSLRDEDYRGPEAFVIHARNRPAIVG